MKCVISVLGKDRSGIVAAVATALAECDANIDDISQTILGEGEIFSMTMLTTLAPEVCDFNTVQERLEKVGEDLGVQIIIQREDVFQMMYKLEHERYAKRGRPPAGGRSCVWGVTPGGVAPGPAAPPGGRSFVGECRARPAAPFDGRSATSREHG